MRPEILQALDGYEKLREEIDVRRRSGTDVTVERGRVSSIIDRLHPDRYTARVNRIIDESPTAKTFRLVPVDRQVPPFLAGQYLSLFLTVGNIRTGRPYSISSPPNQTGYIDLTVRRVAGGLVSNYLLDDIQVGDCLDCSGPAGYFYHNPLIHHRCMVCIAGGSGITPFMSMIREIDDRGLDRDVYLFYGNADPGDIMFHNELNEMAHRNDWLHYVPVVEKPDSTYTGHCGYITADIIRDAVGHTDDKSFFICGPKGLYDFCLPELDGLGIRARQVRREMYGPPADIWEQPGWPAGIGPDDTVSVTVVGGPTIQVPATVPLLASLEKAGVMVPSLCRCGECSRCRIRIVSGTVYQLPGVPVRFSDRQFGYVHSCVSFPLENLDILV